MKSGSLQCPSKTFQLPTVQTGSINFNFKILKYRRAKSFNISIPNGVLAYRLDKSLASCKPLSRTLKIYFFQTNLEHYW